MKYQSLTFLNFRVETLLAADYWLILSFEIITFIYLKDHYSSFVLSEHYVFNHLKLLFIFDSNILLVKSKRKSSSI